MFKRLSMVMLSLCIMGFAARAVNPKMCLIIPYDVRCEKQSDGSELIKVSACFRNTLKNLTVNGVEQTVFNTENPSSFTATTVFQSTVNCDLLDQMFKQNGTLFGYPAIQTITQTITFKNKDQAETVVDVCAYMVNIGRRCCGETKCDVLQKFVSDLKCDGFVCKDLNEGDLFINRDFFTDAPFKDDYILTLAGGTFLDLRIWLNNLANLNFHNKPCCVETFGLNAEESIAAVKAIVRALQGCPTDFTATGTFGSCGDTSPVTVKGTLTKKKMINICGTPYCLTELPSVVDENGFPTEAGMLTTPCLAKFFVDYFSTRFDRDTTGFAKCGYDDEVCSLIEGTEKTGLRDQVVKLVINCVDPDNHIFGFALIYSSIAFPAQSLIDFLGCRFKLEECKPCCK